MIYIVSNRLVNHEKNDEEVFSDDFDNTGYEVLRVARAFYVDSGEWSIELVDEEFGRGKSDIPLYKIFKEVSLSDRSCVVYIHGYDLSVKAILEKCIEIERYGVNVILFLWPPNPGPQFLFSKINICKKARKNVRRSVIALERFFEILCDFSEVNGDSGQLKTLAVNGLGNYLLQSLVVSPDFDFQCSVFKNILIHQADVDCIGHEVWLDKLGKKSRVIVTINETDSLLDYSNTGSPEKLGNCNRYMVSKYAGYYDFTEADGAENENRLWGDPAKRNKHIRDFFTDVFTGTKIRRNGIGFNPVDNCFEVI